MIWWTMPLIRNLVALSTGCYKYAPGPPELGCLFFATSTPYSAGPGLIKVYGHYPRVLCSFVQQAPLPCIRFSK